MKPTDIIHDPGKFEGEPVYVRDLWFQSLDGADDGTIYDGDTPVSIFLLDAESRAAYELEETDHVICLWEDSVGFVRFRVMDEPTFTAFTKECEQSDEEENV